MSATLHTLPSHPRKLSDLLSAFDQSRIRVAKAYRIRDDLIVRLARGDLHNVSGRAIGSAKAALALALKQQAELIGILLDAPDRFDMECPDDLGDAMREALDRIEAPALTDAQDEHRITPAQAGIVARA